MARIGCGFRIESASTTASGHVHSRGGFHIKNEYDSHATANTADIFSATAWNSVVFPRATWLELFRPHALPCAHALSVLRRAKKWQTSKLTLPHLKKSSCIGDNCLWVPAHDVFMLVLGQASLVSLTRFAVQNAGDSSKL